MAGIAIVALFTVFSFYSLRKSANPDIKEFESIRSEMQIIEKISQAMILPEESPAFSTVNNEEPLINIPFFKGVKKGDKLIVFKTAGRAILYDPDGQKIRNVGSAEEAGIKLSDSETK